MSPLTPTKMYGNPAHLVLALNLSVRGSTMVMPESVIVGGVVAVILASTAPVSCDRGAELPDTICRSSTHLTAAAS